MSVIFDGRGFAARKKEDLRFMINDLRNKGVIPKLVSILIGNDEASSLYVNLKKKAAEEVGAEVEVVSLSSSISKEGLIKTIERYNNDDNIHGIMVQLPLPERFSKADKEEILNLIDPIKDVDGLRADSSFLHPTSKACIEIMDYALSIVRLEDLNRSLKICIVGAGGMVGKPLAAKLMERNYDVVECNSKTIDLKSKTVNADVVISATGVPELIGADMVKSGAIIIDVGSPVGDFSKDAYDRASFVSPVPGGVGPVTIICLLENLYLTTSNKQK